MRIGSFEVPLDEVRQYCEHWLISDLALFGSVLREDFRPDSDVDVLVRFQPGAPWSLFDLYRAELELGKIFGRRADISEWQCVENSKNPEFRRAALRDVRQIYVA